ncbi:lipopolysaccharide biosynthesis protein [Aeromicrobium alkaliterrae]|uniref:Lipopolysaccharide biosynthesis protein n=2 Tax=Aeromicrobium alkaliterrae TaxID=302168 RepID=A0ABN2JZS0_9ACTN
MTASSNQDVGRRAVSGAAWVALEKWASRLLSLVVFGILARLLAPEDFGLMAICVSVSTILQIFVQYGLAQVLVQRRELDDREIHTAFWSGLAVSLLLYGLLCASIPLFLLIYDEPMLASILPIAGLVLPLAGLASVPAALLERDLRFRPLAVRQLSGVVVGSSVAVTVAVLGGGVWALVLQPVVTAGVAVVVLWIAGRWWPRLVFSRRALRGMLGFSVLVVATELVGSINFNIDKFVVGAYFDPTVLGYYFMAQRLLTLVLEVASAVLDKVSLSALSRVQDDHQRFQRFFFALTFVSTTLGFALYGVLVGFGDPLTRLVFGPGWHDTVLIAALLAPMFMLGTATYFDKNVMIARGRPAATLGLAVVTLLLGLVILAVTLPWGILAVAAGRSFRQFAFWPVRLYVIRRTANIDIRVYLAQFLAPTVAVLVLAGFGFAVTASPWADAPLSVLTFVIPAVLLGVALYAGVIWLVARRRVREIQSMLKRMYRRTPVPA